MIINKSGIAIRMSVEDLRVMGRATQGVKLINIKGDDSIAAVAKVMKDEDELEEVDIMDIEVTTDNGTAIDKGSAEATENSSEEE
jgi:DNA gyrase subunit A